MSMFKWDVVDPAPGEPVAPEPAAPVGQDGRRRRPARGGHVRRHVRLPARHGAGPQPRDHVLGHLHDPVPADHQQQGAELPRHQRLVRRRRRRDPRPGRRLRRRHRRDHGRRPGAAGRRRARALRRLRADPQDPAAGGDRRRGHADRLQPGAGGGRHLLAPGPVGRAADRHVHGLRRGAAAGLLGPDRGLPRADLRLPALVALRRHLRPDQLGRSAGPPRRPTTTGSAGPAVKAADWIGLPERQARPTVSTSCTARASRSPSSCWCCPVSSR